MSNFTSITGKDISRFDPVSEAYFGRTKHMLDAQKNIKIILDLFYSKFTGGSDYEGFSKGIDLALDSSEGRKALAAVNKAFQKQFGFKEFNLFISRDMSTMGPNAFTVSGVIGYAGAEGLHNFIPLSQKSGGYYDKKHEYVCMVCMTAVILDCMLTPEEVMGLILHEIGHNFQCAPLANLSRFMPFMEMYKRIMANIAKPSVLDTLAIIRDFVGHAVGNEAYTALLKWLDNYWNTLSPSEQKYWNVFYKSFEETRIKIFGVLRPYYDIKFLHDIYKGWVPSVLTMMISICGYSGEVFADSFAVAYGYGPGLDSALSKLTATVFVQYNELMERDAPTKPIFELAQLINEVTDAILGLDEHPTTQKRLLNTMDKLEREIKSGDLTPTLKKQALKDLNEARSVYNKFLEADDFNNKLAMISMYRKLNDFLGGNLDWRNIANKILNLGQYEA